MITWTASNNSSLLNKERKANTVVGAVRASRSYVRSELNGEGRITVFEDGIEIRQDRCDIFTNFKWDVEIL